MKILNELRNLADEEKAGNLQKFFKTRKGEYGEGDVFLGISMPEQRKIAKKYFDLDFDKIKKLLESKFHEERMCGLLILIEKYKKNKQEVFNFYITNRQRINNWDLVDVTCHKIIGDFLIDKDKNILYELIKGSLWEKRIAIVSCFAFIRNDDFNDALKICELVLNDKEDLIHKAAGWMLREIGKMNIQVLDDFLSKYYKRMPRTMLRYAIEKMDEEKRRKFLKN